MPPLTSRRPLRVFRNKIAIKKQRFLEDAIPVRLGRLASHLSSFRSYATFQGSRYTARSLLEETWWFAEWSACDGEPELQSELNVLQLTLDFWQAGFPQIWSDRARRVGVAREAGYWSRRILDMSGLLKQQ
jgi:hypothetical protein